MSQPIAVDCIFDADGRLHVRRIKLDDHWLNVEQGRQWVDEQGQHILVMVAGNDTQEILLSRETLQWRILPRRRTPPIVC